MTAVNAADTRDGSTWPPLPLAAWSDTYATLHMWTQIVGKTRLALAPMANHWWQVPLYVSARGLTTSAIPYQGRTFDVEFDFIDHALTARASGGATRTMPLTPRSVADFHGAYMALLHSLGIDVQIVPVPVEVEIAIPFAEDHTHASYEAEAVNRWWCILVQTERVFERFRNRFLGKTSPTHFFWGSFDLAHTRFSGRPAPRHPGGAPHCPDYVMVEAYSHECSSVGFWPGSGVVAEPAFYAYTYPEPAEYPRAPLLPAGAAYNADFRECILPYNVVRTAASPDDALLAFCQSTYDAAANTGAWDRAALDRPRDLWKGPPSAPREGS